jgi:hypothetical protein
MSTVLSSTEKSGVNGASTNNNLNLNVAEGVEPDCKHWLQPTGSARKAVDVEHWLIEKEIA